MNSTPKPPRNTRAHQPAKRIPPVVARPKQQPKPQDRKCTACAKARAKTIGGVRQIAKGNVSAGVKQTVRGVSQGAKVIRGKINRKFKKQ